jgi:hypothetical protein
VSPKRPHPASDVPPGLTTPYTPKIICGSPHGGVPERLKGADCKSVGLAPTLVRIQPPPPSSRGVVGKAEQRGTKQETENTCLAECRDGRMRRSLGGWLRSFPGELSRLVRRAFQGGCSSMVEQKPSKLMTRVRFPSPAPNPMHYTYCPCGSVVEHSLGKGEVARSIRAMGTREFAVI